MTIFIIYIRTRPTHSIYSWLGPLERNKQSEPTEKMSFYTYSIALPYYVL